MDGVAWVASCCTHWFGWVGAWVACLAKDHFCRRRVWKNVGSTLYSVAIVLLSLRNSSALDIPTYSIKRTEKRLLSIETWDSQNAVPPWQLKNNSTKTKENTGKFLPGCHALLLFQVNRSHIPLDPHQSPVPQLDSLPGFPGISSKANSQVSAALKAVL